MNPNLLGLLPVFIWGISIPVSKMLMMKLGFLAVMGGVQVICGTLGMLNQTYLVKRKIPKDIFWNPYFYVRGAFFIGHIFLIFLANALITKNNVSLIILLNYFWPTAIILSSIALAGVRVTRPVFFVAGIILVLASLSFEILKPENIAMASLGEGWDGLACVLAFIAAILWGLYSAISRKIGDETGGSSAVPVYQIVLGTTLFLSFIPGMATWENLDAPTAIMFIGYGILMFIAYICWDVGMRKGNIVFLSLCADFVPWISLTTAWILLDADLTVKTILSGVMLVFGAIITRYGTLVKKQIPQDLPPE